MTEYWVSTKKHYCKFCKIWIADTPLNRRKHDNGPRHKAAVERNLKEMRQRTLDEERERLEIDKEIAAMQAAAAVSLAKDIENGYAQPEVTSDGAGGFSRGPVRNSATGVTPMTPLQSAEPYAGGRPMKGLTDEQYHWYLEAQVESEKEKKELQKTRIEEQIQLHLQHMQETQGVAATAEDEKPSVPPEASLQVPSHFDEPAVPPGLGFDEEVEELPSKGLSCEAPAPGVWQPVETEDVSSIYGKTMTNEEEQRFDEELKGKKNKKRAWYELHKDQDDDEGPRDIAVESQEGKEVLVTGFKSLVHDDSSQVTTFKKRKRSNNARLRKK